MSLVQDAARFPFSLAFQYNQAALPIAFPSFIVDLKDPVHAYVTLFKRKRLFIQMIQTRLLRSPLGRAAGLRLREGERRELVFSGSFPTVHLLVLASSFLIKCLLND